VPHAPAGDSADIPGMEDPMTDTLLMVDSIGMREATEYAASLRQAGGDPEFVVLTMNPGATDYSISVRPTAPDPDSGEVVIPCSTAAVQPRRPRVQDVEITVEMPDGRMVHLASTSLAQFDAVFWSEAAVEKFLFPYYASKYQWAAARVLETLSQVFYGYVPGFTNPDPPAPGVKVSADDGEEEMEIPFAMAHLPRSDFVPVEDSGLGAEGPTLAQALRDLHVLCWSPGQKKVTHHSMSRFITVPA